MDGEGKENENDELYPLSGVPNGRMEACTVNGEGICNGVSEGRPEDAEAKEDVGRKRMRGWKAEKKRMNGAESGCWRACWQVEEDKRIVERHESLLKIQQREGLAIVFYDWVQVHQMRKSAERVRTPNPAIRFYSEKVWRITAKAAKCDWRHRFDEYYASTPAADEPQPSGTASAAVVSEPLYRYCSSFLLDAVKSAQNSQQTTAQPCDELKQYLSAQLEITPNILHWWGRNFTGTASRNRLNIDLFEALQLLKSAYQNGLISAGEMAARRMDALIAELTEQGFGLEDLEEDI
ncbi:hypothetical protein C8R44DRAFT_863037 [Mycena epipterygia]|nr:hypothetical protein C8R44DRAFT_863037 [Mycena epipterygia]